MLIKWIGPERFIKYGKATNGEMFNVPDKVGNSYISSKLAVKVEADKLNKEVKE